MQNSSVRKIVVNGAKGYFGYRVFEIFRGGCVFFNNLKNKGDGTASYGVFPLCSDPCAVQDHRDITFVYI
jgi:hypothetical protein